MTPLSTKKTTIITEPEASRRPQAQKRVFKVIYSANLAAFA